MRLVKNILRQVLIFLHLDLTKNLKYDRLTREIFKKYLKKDFNCIDVGCHKGEILNLMLKFSPEGKHYGFEPIPYLFKELENTYKNTANIFPYALSDRNGVSTFQFVKNAPAYSGLKRRRYDIQNPEIEEIQVELRTLDQIVPENEKIQLIKIDVEGGEFDVLKGAQKLLLKNKPVIIFECGKGSSDYYGATPIDLYNFIIDAIGLGIYTLKAYVKQEGALTLDDFTRYYNSNEEYYFVAANGKVV